MPCYDDRSSASWVRENELEPLKKRLDITTRLACEYLTELEYEHGKWAIPEWAKEWWEAHKLEDKQRRKDERDRKRRIT